MIIQLVVLAFLYLVPWYMNHARIVYFFSLQKGIDIQHIHMCPIVTEEDEFPAPTNNLQIKCPCTSSCDPPPISLEHSFVTENRLDEMV